MMGSKKLRKNLRKVWWFIWEDNSIWSWIVNIVLAFLIIKFLIYPGLGFIMQTSYPIVAVVSGSMEHDGKFDDWWSSKAVCGEEVCTQEEWYEERGITKQEFLEFKFKNGFNKGDIMVLRGLGPDRIKAGDTIVYMSSTAKYPIIHRVIGSEKNGDSYVFATKGDHNAKEDPAVSEKQMLGKAFFRVPWLGWIKIGFVSLISVFAGGFA